MVKTLILVALGMALVATGFFAYKAKVHQGGDMPAALAIIGGRLIDGTGRPPVDNVVILVEDGRIQNVFPAAEAIIPKGAQVLDAHDSTILPGLIDCSVNLMIGSGGAAASPREFMPDRTTRDLRACLYWGNTTIHSTGDPLQQITRLRDSERGGLILSPRLYVVGPIFTAVGGYPALFLPPMIAADATRQLKDAEQAREAVRAVAADDVTMIEVVYDGGREASRYPKLSLQLLAEVTEQAHQSGLKVLAHVGTVSDLKEAIGAGVDAIEAGPSDALDAEAIQLMIERGIYYGSGLSARHSRALSVEQVDRLLANEDVRRSVSAQVREGLENHAGYFFELKQDPALMNYFLKTSETNQKNLLLASQSGVKVFLGTGGGDPTVFYGYSLHDELGMMVDSGLSPAQALAASTGTAAEFLGISDLLGTVEVGKLADILIIDGDPLQDISVTRKIKQIIKGGRIIDRGHLFQ